MHEKTPGLQDYKSVRTYIHTWTEPHPGSSHVVDFPCEHTSLRSPCAAAGVDYAQNILFTNSTACMHKTQT